MGGRGGGGLSGTQQQPHSHRSTRITPRLHYTHTHTHKLSALGCANRKHTQFQWRHQTRARLPTRCRRSRCNNGCVPTFARRGGWWRSDIRPGQRRAATQTKQKESRVSPPHNPPNIPCRTQKQLRLHQVFHLCWLQKRGEKQRTNDAAGPHIVGSVEKKMRLRKNVKPMNTAMVEVVRSGHAPVRCLFGDMFLWTEPDPMASCGVSCGEGMQRVESEGG